MTEKILEYVAVGAPRRIDRERSVIEGVKLLGLVSQNGRSYLKEAVARAVPLYEGAPVNIDHANGARSYADRIGSIHNVRVEQGGGGLRGDLHFNPKHALAEQLLWDAQNSPSNVGLSHAIEARTSRRGGKVIVEEILRVQSVDLVADPATTRGLFEGRGAASEPADLPRDSADFARRLRGGVAEPMPATSAAFAEQLKTGHRPAPGDVVDFVRELKGRTL